MNALQAFALVAVGVAVVVVGFIVFVNKVSAAYDRRGRERVIETYYSPERPW